MKKIGIVTAAKDNFGSLLQCYATQVLLSRLGYEGVLLKRKEGRLLGLAITAGRYLQFLVWCLHHPEKLESFLAVRGQSRISRRRCSELTERAMQEFARDYIRVESVSFGELKLLSRTPDYCAFISGSDQIWSVQGAYRDPMSFLRFAPREKRIAFAPSFGVSEIPAYDRKEIGKYISEYDYLSVRELTGAEIIKELTGREAEVLVDPTLQLDSDFWQQASARHSGMNRHDSKYMFLYFLAPPSPVALETIKQIKMHAACDILAVSRDHSEFQELEGYRFVDGGPLDYVSLIANAALVCTDSFHATAFSMNLNTPFLSFDSQYGRGHTLNTSGRLLSLLSICHLEERFITDVPDPTRSFLEMDFTESNRLLGEERKKAIHYLSTSLESVNAKV